MTNKRDRSRSLPSHRTLSAVISNERALIARLEQEIAAARNRLAALRSQETATVEQRDAPRGQASRLTAASPQTPEDKVRLFRTLFRGREDVFATRFVAKKTGKAGYAPACRNKFVDGLCQLPKIKCADCTNQAFVPYGDAAVLGHLQGHYVVGIYPLLEDETCWFLAVDFDKTTWKEDAAAFVETCSRLSLPVAIERSRSGAGAHIWCFFSAPVAATTARKMGCYLLTETMSRHHELGMDSYDRLFPSQDTLPRGGFGNLIALPLQHEARKVGNSIFLDEQLTPYPDDQQWTYLAGVKRIDPQTVMRVAEEASQNGLVIGVRPADDGDASFDRTPWMRPPSGKRPAPPLADGVPAEIRAVLAQKLFVEKKGLPAALVDQIKRLAAFQNPEFYKKQSMRLSTATTPRVIACAQELPEHIGLPRGCRADLESLLRPYGTRLSIDDQRLSGSARSSTFEES